MDINKVVLVGRLSKNPELKSVKSGQSVATFSLATNRVWTDKNNQKQEQVDFHNIVVWGRQAESAAKFLIKGQMIGVEGRIMTRSYEDKAGSKRYVTEIIAERLSFGPKPAGGVNTAAKSVIDDIPTVNIDEEIKPEDLPF